MPDVVPGFCPKCGWPDYLRKHECGETESYEITIHRSELIPGGNGARIGYSGDFPGKQFLFIPQPVSGRTQPPQET